MTIALASDHGGYHLKAAIITHLEKKGLSCIDFGTNGTASVDYPDYGFFAVKAVHEKQAMKAIVICGSGVGISIVANKVKGIRCARCENEYVAKLSRLHNDSNVLALGERVLGEDLALAIVDAWLETEFDGGERHQKRLAKIAEIENHHIKDLDPNFKIKGDGCCG